MADAAAILDRIRSFGANVVLDGDQLRLINSRKLPAEARAFLAQHREAIGDLLRRDREASFEERAAIVEFDAGAPREWAEAFARFLTRTKPAHVSEIEWSWFLGTCGRMIDEAPKVAA
ncbi:hypothetical protein [Pelagibacterium lacus]|uniref:TubC N-terminal docking domain-containing protein n=1 Tax=Pelagibacterium lacus TaxID=2282655 RepID=A0A369W4U3_9HYPH|nr:hypothetical protein [Pelagibacterium lacus]RDE08370.1 hypothetical protein DVH29_11605 [Pelagibacterium lacus]